MALYKVKVDRSITSNGIRLEKGMVVDVITKVTTNPVSVNNGEAVKEAFKRVHGVDLSSVWGAVRSALSVIKQG